MEFLRPKIIVKKWRRKLYSKKESLYSIDFITSGFIFYYL